LAPALVGVTTDPKPARLRNIGDATLQLGTIEVTGPNLVDFEIVDDPSNTTVPVGGEALLSVTFTAGDLGARLASVSILNDAPGSPHQLPLKGFGGIPKAGVAPAVVDFGDQKAGTESAGKVAKVSNTGTGPMQVTSVELSDGDITDFVIFKDAATGDMAPGGSGTVEVHFTPQSTGNKAATLRITHDAPEPDLTVTLKGRGVP
jgi:hypothetical protein